MKEGREEGEGRVKMGEKEERERQKQRFLVNGKNLSCVCI